MLVTLNEVLKDAQAGKYGVGLFNTINMEMARGVIAAAEELKAPVIIGTAEVLLKFTPLDVLACELVLLARNASVPVVLHFDHGLTKENIVKALKSGFTSVMYDCSTLPYEENVAEVRKMAQFARYYGATIEGELGHVGTNADPDSETDVYTRPEEARDYADRTQIDALAVAIGTAHGVYKEKPVLDIGRLKEIRSVVDTPLVLHGGSGLTAEDFRSCIREGIAKVNIFTDINIAAAKASYDNYIEGKGYSLTIPKVVEAVKKVAEEKMKLFGSEGKG